MVWQYYKRALTRYPLPVKATTAATLMSCSDFLGQTYEQAGHRQSTGSRELEDGSNISTKSGPENRQKKSPVHTNKSSRPDNNPAHVYAGRDNNAALLEYNWQRTMHVGLTGFTFSGPISHGWYNLVETVVGRMALSTVYYSVGVKMFLDALLFSPIAVAGYFVWRSVLEGTDVRWKLEHKWMGALQASWSFWPLANIVNFSLVPLPFRVLFNNGLSLFWNAYLSNVNQSRLVDLHDQRDAINGDSELNGGTNSPKIGM